MKNKLQINNKYGVKIMISISEIRSYMFCPLKLYFEKNIDKKDDDDMFKAKIIKDLRIDLEDLLHKNLRKLKKDMEIPEIENTLSQQVLQYIETSFKVFEEISENEENGNQNNNENENENENKDMEQIIKQKGDLISEIFLKIKILSIKSKEAMKIFEKEGSEIQGLFFSSCMYNYLIRDIGLDLIGVVDKIEVEKGNYSPVSLKSSKPPLRGVWDNDIIEIVADALLIEQEFDTHISVGYVDYLKINERRAVVVDNDLRKTFFKILTNINNIVEKKEIPRVRTNLRKCENCEYKELCENNEK